MRQRALSADGDFLFGYAQPFLIDSPQCVAQAILTRLRLESGEWFLDVNEGTDYNSIVGYNHRAVRDLVIRNRILDTPGVERITKYSSSVDKTRKMTVAATVLTVYGSAAITITV